MELQHELSELENTESNFLRYLKFSVPFLTNLDYYYKNADLRLKQFIIGSIFPEKLYYSNSTYRTSKLNEVLNLITNAGKDAMDLRNKKAPKNQGLSNVAPPSGLEPETL